MNTGNSCKAAITIGCRANVKRRWGAEDVLRLHYCLILKEALIHAKENGYGLQRQKTGYWRSSKLTAEKEGPRGMEVNAW